MSKESLLISFCFRYKFQRSFSVCNLPPCDSDASLSSFFLLFTKQDKF